MKVLITTDWYDPVINGVVTSVHALTERLKEQGHEVRVLTLSRNRRSYSENHVYYIGSTGAGKIYPEARFHLPFLGWCARELMEWKPDIIHSQCEFSTFFLARRIASELGIPIVHTYHTIYEDYTHYFSPGKAWGKSVVQKITRRLSRQVAGMIVPSEKIRVMLEEYQVECPLWVIPSGIDLEWYKEERGGEFRKHIRQKYSIASKTTVLLYVGRLAKEKNIEELLTYQQKIKDKETVLMIVGGGPYQKALEKQAHEMEIEENVIFTGMIPREEVRQYYQAGDLFVSASTSETQGMTYGEALAAGLPLLCRKDPCLDGVVKEGENGWQYENLEQFLTFLEKWKKQDEDSKREMCTAALESAKLFSSAVFGRRVEEIYEQERKQECHTDPRRYRKCIPKKS